MFLLLLGKKSPGRQTAEHSSFSEKGRWGQRTNRIKSRGKMEPTRKKAFANLPIIQGQLRSLHVAILLRLRHRRIQLVKGMLYRGLESKEEEGSLATITCPVISKEEKWFLSLIDP